MIMSRVSNLQKPVSFERRLRSWNIEYNFKWNQPYLSRVSNLSRCLNFFKFGLWKLKTHLPPPPLCFQKWLKLFICKSRSDKSSSLFSPGQNLFPRLSPSSSRSSNSPLIYPSTSPHPARSSPDPLHPCKTDENSNTESGLVYSRYQGEQESRQGRVEEERRGEEELTPKREFIITISTNGTH